MDGTSRRKKHCVCDNPSRYDIRTNGDELIAQMCARCTLPIFVICRVCRKRFVQLTAHLQKTECGELDKKGMWWSKDRPPIASYHE